MATAKAAIAAAQTAAGPAAEGFSSETARILRSLGEPAAPAAPSTPPTVDAAGAAEAPEAVAAEQLRHPAPVLSVQWSPGTLQSGAEPVTYSFGSVYSFPGAVLLGSKGERNTGTQPD